MPAEKRHSSLARLVLVTERMLACAESEDWAALEMLDRERAAELSRCFDESVEADESSLVSEAIAALLILNDRLVEQVSQARGRVVGEATSLRQGRLASASYVVVENTG